MTPNSSSRRTSVRLLLAAGHVLILAGIGVAAHIGRPRFFGLGLYIAVGFGVFTVLLYPLDWTRPSSNSFSWNPYEVVLHGRFVASLLLLSVTVALVLGRGALLYLTFGVVALLLLFRAVQRGSYTHHLTLLLGGGLLVVMLQAQVLLEGFYFGTGDTVMHTSFIWQLLETGHLDAISDTRSFYFSLFHVYSTAATLVFDTGVRTAVGIYLPVLFAAGGLGVFALIREVWGSATVGTVGFMLTVVAPTFIDYGSRVHYQSYSFVLFCFVLYALFRRDYGRRFVLLTLFLSVVWIPSHMVTVAIGFVVLAVLLGSLVSAHVYADTTLLSRNRATLFVALAVGAVTYWSIVSNAIAMPFVWIFLLSPGARGEPLFVVSQYEPGLELLVASLPFLLDSLHYSFWISMFGIGGVSYGYAWATERTTHWLQSVFLVGGVLAAIVYFPNPLWMPVSGFLELSRWRLSVFPLLVCVTAYGLVTCLDSTARYAGRRPVHLLVVFLLVVTSLSTGLSNPSFAGVVHEPKEQQQFLSDRELSSISFVSSHHTADQRTFSRNPVQFRLEQRQWLREEKSLQEIRSRGPHEQMLFNPETGSFATRSGLTLFPEEAFTTQGISVGIVVETDFEEGSIVVRDVVRPSSATWTDSTRNVVYDNGGNVVAYDR